MTLRIFIKTLNPWLTAIFLLCVIIVFALDMWLFEIEAPFKLFVAMGKFNYGVSVSYIAAYIFYLITVYYPETKNAISIYTAASFPAQAIVTNVNYIFIDMGKQLSMDMKPEDLTEEIINEILIKTKCYGDSTLSKPDLTHYSWVEYLSEKESVIKSFENQVHLLYPKMDGEYIAAISEVEHADPIKQMLNGIRIILILGKAKKADITFGNGFDKMLIGLYQSAQNLKYIIDKTNRRYEIKN